MRYDHVVICGGGFAGMVAAITSSRTAAKVTIIERYPDSEASKYAGTPQAHHVHIMSKKGQIILEQLIPGTLAELSKQGALEVDWALNTVWQGQNGKCPHYESGVRSLLFSRKLIEKVLYNKVLSTPNIFYRAATVKEFIVSAGKVESIILSQGEAITDFDLCIEARGRTSTLKENLEKHIGPIPESIIKNTMRYATTIIDHKSDTANDAIMQYYSQSDSGSNPLGYFASPIEGDRFIFTTTDYHGNINNPFEALKSHPMLIGREIAERWVFTKLHNHHVKYGKAKAWISNLAVIGDAVCRLNPSYGHGLTLSVEHVQLLNKAFQDSKGVDTRKLQRNIDNSIREPWNFVKIDELRSSKAKPSLYYRIVHKFIDFMGAATLRDQKLHKTSLEVLHRLKSPLALLTPLNLMRVSRAHLMQLKPDILPLFMRTVATLALLALSSLAHSAEISDRMVSANGEKFHILESGDRSAPLVLFLHGFPEHAGIWRDYLRDLGNYHAVAVDQRGYNLSGKPGNLSDYKLSKLIEDIKALSLSLGHQKAALVAHDWGGIVAWHAISKYPETFTKAVILNAPHPRTYAELLKHDAEQKNSAFYQYILKLPFSESLLSLNDHYPLRRAMFEGSKKPFSRAEQEGFRSAWGQGLGGAINYYRANDFRNSEELDSVKPIDIPVLLLWGERDEWLSEKNLEGNERWAKRLTIKRFPDATHWIQHEKTREVLYDIQKFLEKD